MLLKTILALLNFSKANLECFKMKCKLMECPKIWLVYKKYKLENNFKINT